MDIDRNNGNYAMIAGNLPTFCLFDIQKMTHQKLNFAPNTPFIPFYDTEDDDRFILPFDHSPITAHFIDRDNSGYFAIY